MILIILIVGIQNIVCFFIGAKIGQKVSRDETITIPKFNPVEKYEERLAKKEAQKEQKKLEVILKNIENYNGTDIGQEDVPE